MGHNEQVELPDTIRRCGVLLSLMEMTAGEVMIMRTSHSACPPDYGPFLVWHASLSSSRRRAAMESSVATDTKALDKFLVGSS